MTALQQFQRLESTGLWRPDASAQRREVGVAFGNATLVISDTAGRALAHWSLPAVEQMQRDGHTVTYSPAIDATETLEISDTTMIDAIETVRKALQKQRPKSGRLRTISRLAVVAGLGALAVFWLPGALREQTLSVVTQTKRAEIGNAILGHMQTQAGRPCNGAQGQAALAQMHQRLFGASAAGRIVVLPRAQQSAVALPGGLIAMDQSVLALVDDPSVAAGFAVQAQAQARHYDPLGAVLDVAGLRETMRLLTTGAVSQDALAGFAAHLSQTGNATAPTDTIIAAFDDAALSTVAFATAINDSALAEADPMAGRAVPPVLPDSAWVSLQGICAT